MDKQKYFDILNQQNKWVIGYLIRKQKQNKYYVCPDGYHPNNSAYYCLHNGKIQPVRTYTFGLNIQENHKTLRSFLTLAQLDLALGKLNLYNLQQRLIQLPVDNIRVNIRTQLLILIDKIMTGPFQIIKEQKLASVTISKIFIIILNLYMRLLQSSKKIIPFLDNSPTAGELYKSFYEMTMMVSMIIGFNLRSNVLYNHQLNLTIKSQGFLQYLIDQKYFPSQFKTAFLNFQFIQSPQKNDLKIVLEVITLFLDLCENKKKNICSGKYQEQTQKVIGQIISLIKCFAQKSQEIRKDLNDKHKAVINRIQSVYLKLKPGEQINLKESLGYSDMMMSRQSLLARESVLVNNQEVQKGLKENKDKVTVMQQKMAKMEQMVAKMIKNQEETCKKLQETQKKCMELEKQKQNQKASIAPRINFDGSPQSIKNFLLQSLDSMQPQNSRRNYKDLPVENLGQQMFLGSLQWALQTNQIQTAQKLVKWRRSLLQIGRIVGWQIAMVIGCRTYKKGIIQAQDIIDANYEYIVKNSNFAMPKINPNIQQNNI